MIAGDAPLQHINTHLCFHMSAYWRNQQESNTIYINKCKTKVHFQGPGQDHTTFLFCRTEYLKYLWEIRLWKEESLGRKVSSEKAILSQSWWKRLSGCTPYKRSVSGQPQFSLELSSRTSRLEIVPRNNYVQGLGTEKSKEKEKDGF